MMNLNRNKIIAFLLIGVGLLSTVNLDFELMTPSDKDTYPSPDETLRALVEPLKADFSAGDADVRGLFDAIGLEILTNDKLVKLSQVKELNAIVVGRFLPMVSFKTQPGLGSKLDAILLEVEADPNAELTPELRKQLAEAYFALEWMVRQ